MPFAQGSGPPRLWARGFRGKTLRVKFLLESKREFEVGRARTLLPSGINYDVELARDQS